MAKTWFTTLAIVFAIGTAYLAFQSKNRIEELQDAFKKQNTLYVQTKDELKRTKDDLAATKTELEATKTELEGTKASLVTAKEQLAKTAAELETTKASLASKEAEIQALKEEILKVTGGENAQTLGEQIAAMMAEKQKLETDVQRLTKENAELNTTVDSLTSQKKELDETVSNQNVKIDRWEKNIAQKGLRGRVMAVNAGWNFVVLDIGDKQGAALNRELVVVRNGQGIGKVRITSVEARQSIADIVPRSLAKGIFPEPGDSVIYTGEDKPATDLPTDPAALPGAPGIN